MKEFLEELASKLSQAAKKPNVLAYAPNSDVHKEFHESAKIGRILQGGNRSGKSTAGMVESVWRATGRHPYQKTHDAPIRGRIVTVDKDNGIELIVKPLLAQWTPPSELVNGSFTDSFNSAKKSMTFRNGSVIDLKTHQQEVDAFAGVPLHFVHFDEEPPAAIFNECRMRLIDFKGVWYMTMTPVKGQNWIFDRFLAAASKNVDLFEVGIESNPHLNQEALKILDDDLTEDEKELRQKGNFTPLGGRILKQFDHKRHVIEAPDSIPESWAIYVSIDHGFNNPTAILWHAVSPKGDVVTFFEHYKAKMLIKNHAERIHEVNRYLGIKPILYLGDPSMAQKNGETGASPLMVYRENKIPLMQSTRNVAGRIDKMNEYLEYDRWHITQNCPNLIKEIRGYSFKVHVSPKIADRSNVREEPNKKNDHAVDSCGYFFNKMPYLTPELKTLTRGMSQTVYNKEDFPWEVDSTIFARDEVDTGWGEY